MAERDPQLRIIRWAWIFTVNASAAHNLQAANCCVNHELADNKGCLLFTPRLLRARWHGAIHWEVARGWRPNHEDIKYLKVQWKICRAVRLVRRRRVCSESWNGPWNSVTVICGWTLWFHNSTVHSLIIWAQKQSLLFVQLSVSCLVLLTVKIRIEG